MKYLGSNIFLAVREEKNQHIWHGSGTEADTARVFLLSSRIFVPRSSRSCRDEAGGLLLPAEQPHGPGLPLLSTNPALHREPAAGPFPIPLSACCQQPRLPLAVNL